MRGKKALVAFGVLAAMSGALLVAKKPAAESSAPRMATAAKAFLTTLSDAQREKASFEFGDKERTNWHFIPRERKGLPLKELEGEPLRTAHRLIATGLSNAGYDQAVDVMSLEEILYLLEGGEREERRAKRDPQKYYISIFGKPGDSGSWGWRVEGHHLSLNFTLVDGKIASSTPEFFGANPGTIQAGPGREIRVLGAEEDLARQILKLCTPALQKKMWIDKKAPADLRGGGVAQPVLEGGAVGIKFSEMSNDQKKLLGQLLAEYLKNMPADIEAARRAQIKQAGMDDIHVSWWGSSERDEGHYYRVQGPTFIIEYNNTQNSANHVHSIWRDTAGDFNIPL
ncbi:MAG: DUF3500 domain-containing protein [Planctomycetota bacterium]|nr:DUF3500 domain-containing protein [Planctomycetota bacterium]